MKYFTILTIPELPFDFISRVETTLNTYDDLAKQLDMQDRSQQERDAFIEHTSFEVLEDTLFVKISEEGLAALSFIRDSFPNIGLELDT